MCSCLNCGADCSELMTFDNSFVGFIICPVPTCGTKMLLQFDEVFDPETGYYDNYFWLEKFTE